jgi:hypothetical protein
MSEVITKVLTEKELTELNSQLDPNEELKFLFKFNCIPIENSGSERYHCKNGHFNFISNYMGFQPNAVTKIKCSECDEIIFEFKPYGVRTRELQILEIIK